MKQNAVTPRVAIIGLGNVLLGDDGIEAGLSKFSRASTNAIRRLRLATSEHPGLDLAPYLYGKDLVVIVDTVNADAKPGTVRTYRADDFLHSQAQLRLTDHDVGLAESLAQLRLADCAPSEVVVVGVIPESCEFGKGISPTVFAASSVAVAQVAELLRERGFACDKRSDPLKPKLWWFRERRDEVIEYGG